MHKIETYSTKLRAKRLRLGWTQQDLAFFARMSVADVSRIETGRMKPYPSQVNRLARILRLDPEELLDEVDEVGAECLAAT